MIKYLIFYYKNQKLLKKMNKNDNIIWLKFKNNIYNKKFEIMWFIILLKLIYLLYFYYLII